MKFLFLLVALPALSAPPQLKSKPKPVECSQPLKLKVDAHTALENAISRAHAPAVTAVKESKKQITEGIAIIRSVYARACAALDLEEGKIAASELESQSLAALASKDRAKCVQQLETLRDKAAQKGKKLVGERMFAIHQPFHRASAELSQKYGKALKSLLELEFYMRENPNPKPPHYLTENSIKTLTGELENALGDFSAHSQSHGKRTALKPGSRYANFDDALMLEYRKAESANAQLSSLEEAYDVLVKSCGNFSTIKP